MGISRKAPILCSRFQTSHRRLVSRTLDSGLQIDVRRHCHTSDCELFSRTNAFTLFTSRTRLGKLASECSVPNTNPHVTKDITTPISTSRESGMPLASDERSRLKLGGIMAPRKHAAWGRRNMGRCVGMRWNRTGHQSRVAEEHAPRSYFSSRVKQTDRQRESPEVSERSADGQCRKKA